MTMDVWREIPGFDGRYLINRFGLIYSMPRASLRGVTYGGKFMKGTIQKNKGYVLADLSDGITKRSHSIHRLVAKTFLDNPENKPTVNHINCIKHDNSVLNLEWATWSENNKHVQYELPEHPADMDVYCNYDNERCSIHRLCNT